MFCFALGFLFLFFFCFSLQTNNSSEATGKKLLTLQKVRFTWAAHVLTLGGNFLALLTVLKPWENIFIKSYTDYIWTTLSGWELHYFKCYSPWENIVIKPSTGYVCLAAHVLVSLVGISPCNRMTLLIRAIRSISDTCSIYVRCNN